MKRPFVIKPASVPNGEINVTPLVDVVLVLLIIFMVVTPLAEKDIDLALPNTEKVEEVTEIPPDQVIVRLDPTGKLDINGVDVSVDGYVGELRTRLMNRTDKTVFVVADDRANYARLVHTLDGAKAAGALTLGMATDAPAP